MSRRPRFKLRRWIQRNPILHPAPAIAPVLLAISLSAVANAQGTMDFSGAQTLMSTFKTFAIYAGAIICFGGLIFAGIRMMSGRFQDAIPGLFGALFGAGVLGWGAGWIGHGSQILICLSRHSRHPARVRAACAGRRRPYVRSENAREETIPARCDRRSRRIRTGRIFPWRLGHAANLQGAFGLEITGLPQA